MSGYLVSCRMSERMIRVVVVAGARKERVEERDGRLAISVKEPAEGGRANARVRELVARHCAAPLSRVSLVKGHKSPRKTFKIAA